MSTEDMNGTIATAIIRLAESQAEAVRKMQPGVEKL